jgi:hypothetical protein
MKSKFIPRFEPGLRVAGTILLSLLSGCSSAPATEVRAQPEIVNRSGGALATASLKWLNGTYGPSCVSRSGAWSLDLGGTPGLMDNPALSVVKSNVGCELAVTALVADVTYSASPALPLKSTYGSTASAFSKPGEGPSFYGNAKLDTSTFDGNFVLSLLFSGDPSGQTGSTSGTYASSTATSSSSAVAPPDYAFDLSGVAYQYDVNKVVTSVSGGVALTDRNYQGESYVVDTGTLGASPTFADYDAAYASGTKTSISATNPTVDTSKLLSVGTNVSSPVVRTILIRRVVDGVVAYQAIRVTFT